LVGSGVWVAIENASQSPLKDGDDKMATIYNNTPVTVTTSNNPAVTYGPFSITVGNKNTIIQPDLGTLTLLADGSTADSIVSGNDFTFLSNKITAGNGTNTIYGTMYELDIIAINGVSNSDDSLSSGLISDNSLTFYGNKIAVGNGSNDTVYGTMRELNMSVMNLGGIGGNVGGDVKLTFYGNSLSVGNGASDQLYGAVGDFNLVLNNRGFVGALYGGSTSLSFGSNSLTSGNGAGDHLYGTFGDVNLTMSLDSFLGGFKDSGSSVFSLKTASNTLNVGNGAFDMLYGTMETLKVASSDSSTLGVYGNPDNPNYDGANNVFQFGTEVSPSVYIGSTLIAGNGTDAQLYGTLSQMMLSVFADASPYGGTIGDYDGAPNLFFFGKNTLIAGNGANDKLYGTLSNISLSASGEYGLIGGAFSSDPQTNNGGNEFNFGGNNLIAGNGANALYGTMEDLTLSAVGPNDGQGSWTFVGGLDGGFNAFTFGNNIVTAGNGKGDVLYGSMRDVHLSAATGGAVGNYDPLDTSGASYNLIQFGNNTVTAGNGKGDILYADMRNLSINIDNGYGSLIDGNIIQFGTSVLNAGNGGDTMVGQLNHIDVAGETLAQFLSQNTFIAGHTTFNTGNGADTLVFDVAINMGTNIVNHFNVSQDILKFNNATGTATNTNIVGALDSASNVQISSDGVHGTMVTFLANGGSIDFTDVTYTGQSHLSDLVNNQTSHLVIV
jgi:hypothetical protein